MHELSLAQAVADTVVAHAEGRGVARVTVQIGHLRQVVPDSMQFAWEVLTEGTDLAGCELELQHVPAVVECGACGAETVLDWPAMVCGTCGSTEVELRSGEEFLILSIDVREAVP